jgi:hypothetical protein
LWFYWTQIIHVVSNSSIISCVCRNFHFLRILCDSGVWSSKNVIWERSFDCHLVSTDNEPVTFSSFITFYIKFWVFVYAFIAPCQWLALKCKIISTRNIRLNFDS